MGYSLQCIYCIIHSYIAYVQRTTFIYIIHLSLHMKNDITWDKSHLTHYKTMLSTFTVHCTMYILHDANIIDQAVNSIFLKPDCILAICPEFFTATRCRWSFWLLQQCVTCSQQKEIQPHTCRTKWIFLPDPRTPISLSESNFLCLRNTLHCLHLFAEYSSCHCL
jgi:hypothetical protein